MTEEEALLRAVIDSPIDDLPRLAYADKLDEGAGYVVCAVCDGHKGWFADTGKTEFVQCSSCRGRGWRTNGNAERAEFIRLQIEIANAQPGGGGGHSFADCHRPYACEICTRSKILREREQGLIDAYMARWLSEENYKHEIEYAGLPLERNVVGDHLQFGFDRGLIGTVLTSTRRWFGTACPRCRGKGKEIWQCKVCMACTDLHGFVNHGRGCFAVSENGGGEERIEQSACFECRGEAYEGGLGRTLVRLHPLVRVDFRDLNITSLSDAGPFSLTTDIVPFLKSGTTFSISREWLRSSLSEAALAWARERYY